MHKFEVHFLIREFCLHDNVPHPREVFSGGGGTDYVI